MLSALAPQDTTHLVTDGYGGDRNVGCAWRGGGFRALGGGGWDGSVVVVLGVVHRLPRGDLGQSLAGAPQLPRDLRRAEEEEEDEGEGGESGGKEKGEVKGNVGEKKGGGI